MSAQYQDRSSDPPESRRKDWGDLTPTEKKMHLSLLALAKPDFLDDWRDLSYDKGYDPQNY